MQFYINPVIRKYEFQEGKYDQFLNKNSTLINDLSKLTENKLQFILGNPGLGKTRLLKQLVIENNQNGLASVFVECKELENDTIENYLKDKLRHEPIDIDKVDINNVRNFFYTDTISLSKKRPFVICLDALDEIGKSSVVNIYQKIKDFLTDYKQAKFVVSLRNFMLDEVKDLFAEYAPLYFQISMFGRKEIEAYLKHYNFTDEEIQTVCLKLDTYYPQFAQCAPRFLETIRKLKELSGINSIKNSSRVEIFNKYIYNELSTDEKLKTDVDGLISCLQIMALFAKMTTSVTIGKSDFNELRESVNSSTFEATIREITKNLSSG